MRRMPKTAKVLVSNSIGLEGAVADMGFDVIALAPKEVREIAPQLRVEVSPRLSGTFFAVQSARH